MVILQIPLRRLTWVRRESVHSTVLGFYPGTRVARPPETIQSPAKR
jgi:hypothetical protein